MRIYAHRGASAAEPENTLRAFRRAIEVGANGIELDVRATTDGIPIILHDRDLGRTTNGSGNVDELTFAEIRRLDAGRGEAVPALAEVLDLVGSRAHLDIEIKQAGVEDEVLAVLDSYPDVQWAISSFDWNILSTIRALRPEAEFWPLAVDANDDLFSAARDLRATALSLYAPSLTSAVAERCRTEGLEIVVWTVNDVAVAKRMRDLGAAGLCTDQPAEILAALPA